MKIVLSFINKNANVFLKKYLLYTKIHIYNSKHI
jgi:hypothetical protein